MEMKISRGAIAMFANVGGTPLSPSVCDKSIHVMGLACYSQTANSATGL